MASQEGQDVDCKREFMNCFKDWWLQGEKMYPVVSAVSLGRVIQRLNSGVGHDGVHSAFLKNATENSLRYLTGLYNSCLSHCYLPIDLLKGTITPIIKKTTRVMWLIQVITDL